MKGRLLNCIPSIRWVPHDIPASKRDVQRSRFSRSKTHNKRRSKSNERETGLLSHRRKSAISITSKPDIELDARTHTQGQSMFFSKLPIEIRKMVYEELMGEETVHLTLGHKGRFGHFVCEEGEVRECGCRVLVGGRDSRRLGSWRPGFLRVCRRMYTEAVSHLYTPHTFSVLHITHLLYLPSRLSTPRLNSIRTLRLRWAIRALPYLRRGPSKKLAYPEDSTNWTRGWQIIASMAALRDLYVALVDPSPFQTWEGRWLELEGDLLEPVKSVVVPKWAEVWLPYSSCHTDWDMGESRVLLKKPDIGDDTSDDGD